MTGDPRSSWPRSTFAFGGDFNPEQWPEETLDEDIALMQEAGVNLVSIGIFSWAHIEREEGVYEFAWLDRVMDRLHAGGIRVDLATASASPPPWFSHRYPQSLPQLENGTVLSPGSRQAFCPSSPEYRRAAVALATRIAERYRDHPALSMWHVHNEYACHNAHCFCDVSAQAFRGWLQRKYQSIDGLNAAWGTAFWSQRYNSFDEILPPRQTGTFKNPTQQIDWWRFSSDELLACYVAERDALRAITPDIPITTNFMGFFKPLDYQAWAKEMDFISNDHYLLGWLEDPHIHLSATADLCRGLAGGKPWLLMEHSTSAVNWQPSNAAKAPGEMARNSLAHAARGADGILFFQWRASKAGAEKWHSALVPHAGRDTKIWREVVDLSRSLQAMPDVLGSGVPADVAILMDWDSWWSSELDAHPTSDLDWGAIVLQWYSALWRAHITVDFVEAGADLSGYKVVLAPQLYMTPGAVTENLTGFVQAGGTLVVGPFSGMVDENDHVILGGYPGGLREVLGVRFEEVFPLAVGATVPLTNGMQGSLWSELGRAQDAKVIAEFAAGPVAGSPAITRNTYGTGAAWYLATMFDAASLSSLLLTVMSEAGVAPVVDAPPNVEAVRRSSDSQSWLFLLNHGDDEALVRCSGTNMLTGDRVDGQIALAGGGVAVLRED
jgi:beta-galactosidase